MSKAYEMIAESLNELIQELEKDDGKNLKRETLPQKKPDEKVAEKKISVKKENFLERTATF